MPRPVNPARDAEALYEILDASARHGKVCPRLTDLAMLISRSVDTVQRALNSLVAAGRVTSEIVSMDAYRGKQRVVTIVATGMSTARPAAKRRPDGAATRRDELDLAKNALRKAGKWVWDASIDGGPKGLIKVDGKEMTPAEVLVLARQVAEAASVRGGA